MKKKLSTEWTKRLLAMPESGMGYQRVDIVFTDGTTLSGAIVVNASLVDLPDSVAGKGIRDIRLNGDSPAKSSEADPP